jgi:hypothetical protein
MSDHILSINLSNISTEDLERPIHGLAAATVNAGLPDYLVELCRAMRKELNSSKRASSTINKEGDNDEQRGIAKVVEEELRRGPYADGPGAEYAAQGWEELKRMGLISRTGHFRNGQPVWDFTQEGRDLMQRALKAEGVSPKPH